MSGKIRVGIWGCGAITQNAHLPAALRHPDVLVTMLIDGDLKRARMLCDLVGAGCQAAPRSSDVFGRVDAVINALPNHLHASATLEALDAGVHVLCEKPLALTASDARLCCEAADAKKLVLAVGMNRRFDDCQALLPIALEEGLIGPVVDYDWEYGSPWEWETASGFYLSHAQAGGGVLMDFGVHLLDSLLDWFGPVTDLDYEHDDWGSGVEANATLNLRHSGRFGQVTGRVRLSRTCNLKNRLWVKGQAACAELPAADRSVVMVHRSIAGQAVNMTLRLTGAGQEDSIFRQTDDFVESIEKGRRPRSDGWQAVQVIGLVERCYAQARRLPEPWAEPQVVLSEALP